MFLGNSSVGQYCEFCDEFSNGTTDYVRSILGTDEFHTRIIVETREFLVIPGLGALTEGYILILPKKHYRSMAYLPDQNGIFDELEMLMTAVRSICEDAYQSEVIFFEHGACSNTDLGGSCVDHAHIHSIPLNHDIRCHLATSFEERAVEDMRFLSTVAREQRSYLFLEDQSGSRFLYFGPRQIPSQYIRRLWAKAIGRPNEWDWAVYIGKENLLNTWLQLRTLFEKHLQSYLPTAYMND